MCVCRNRYSCCSAEWLVAHIRSLQDTIGSELLASSPYVNGEAPGAEDALLFAHAVHVLSGEGAERPLALPVRLKEHFVLIRDTFFRGSGSKYQVP
jgi:hypothetical protein